MVRFLKNLTGFLPLSLLDPATGARIDLDAFGPTNMAEFARFLPADVTPTPRQQRAAR